MGGIAMTLSDRLRQLRQTHGYSQTDLAQKLGVSQNTITSYESGRTEPGITMLVKLAAIFGVTSDYLIGINPQASDTDTDLIDRIRALPPQDKLVAHKIITALSDRDKMQSRKLGDG